MAYLRENIPSFDVINAVTLGFVGLKPVGEDDRKSWNYAGIDGLDQGIVNVGINYSLTAKMQYPWASKLSRALFYEFVLPYAVVSAASDLQSHLLYHVVMIFFFSMISPRQVNEARNNWRPLMQQVLDNLLISSAEDLSKMSVSDVVYFVNDMIWSGAFGNTVVFKSSQTPLIFDPMTIIVFGYASCTGVSIFLIDALRSIGVAARMAGTPAWNRNPSNGNHNWVEVYTEANEWQFIEARPAGGGETLTNPCDKWFCTPTKFANGTTVFASAYNQNRVTRYPLAWDMGNSAIPGIDRTAYYQRLCAAC